MRKQDACQRPWSMRNPIFWARSVQLALLCMVAVVMLGASESRFERIGHQLMCSCGCGQVLLECNHVGCPDSSRMIGELQAQIATGENDTAVLNWFQAKYGATILATPMRGGFDNIAWIVPGVIFLLATFGTFGVVSAWKRRGLKLAAAAGNLEPSEDSTLVNSNPQDAALRERIRRETEY